ncbi:DUF5662 family protein [Konateibacter massiliensis]|uniref:DUF5662 family protein n=1 Tax=Konateibacter massiliensis TaxID=2002841 RepID=UPI000C144DED|nr:DUF5662 family protein [Konateibacter massiliensis]
MKAIEHFKTITHHKILVMQGCFKLGLYKQGLLHDLSKYSPTEFIVGCKYYQGVRSPNNAEREDKKYSEAWMHHKGRNKHHYEYWTDYSLDGKGIVAVPMPRKYVAEMFVDRVAASKTYEKENYDQTKPLEYFLKGKGHYQMAKKTSDELEKLLGLLAQTGEKTTYWYIKNNFLSESNEAAFAKRVEKW